MLCYYRNMRPEGAGQGSIPSENITHYYSLVTRGRSNCFLFILELSSHLLAQHPFLPQ